MSEVIVITSGKGGVGKTTTTANVGTYLFLSLTGGTPRKLVRHHRSDVQKKQDDTRQSSNGPRTRTPPTYVITAWQAKPDLKTINFNEKRFSGKVTQLSIIR